MGGVGSRVAGKEFVAAEVPVMMSRLPGCFASELALHCLLEMIIRSVIMPRYTTNGLFVAETATNFRPDCPYYSSSYVLVD